MKLSRWQFLGFLALAAACGYIAACSNAKPEGDAQASADSSSDAATRAPTPFTSSVGK